MGMSFSSIWRDIPSLGLSPPCFQIRPNVLPSDGTCCMHPGKGHFMKENGGLDPREIIWCSVCPWLLFSVVSLELMHYYVAWSVLSTCEDIIKSFNLLNFVIHHLFLFCLLLLVTYLLCLKSNSIIYGVMGMIFFLPTLSGCQSSPACGIWFKVFGGHPSWNSIVGQESRLW